MLTRRLGEKVLIEIGGHKMIVCVVEIANLNRVRLSFDGPREIQVTRTELLEEPPSPQGA